MSHFLEFVYGIGGELRLFAYDEFPYGTRYGYRLRRYTRSGELDDGCLTQDGFATKATACAHGLCRLEQLVR